MSDDQSTVPEVPAPPALPDVPEEETVTLKTPANLGSSDETPQSDPAGTVEADPGGDTEGASEDATQADSGQEEADAPPVVETTPAGQTVTFPDGRVVYTRSSDAPASNSEWREYERTHQGDQPRYPFVPGDREYTPYSDPNVPNSHLAQMVEREISSYAERVLQDPGAQVSYIWNALHGVHESELDTAIATGGGSGKVMA